MTRPWEVAGTREVSTQEQAIVERYADMVVPIRHSSDGLMGYESMRCSLGLDGCADRACICVCHNGPTFPDQVSGSTEKYPEAAS